VLATTKSQLWDEKLDLASGNQLTACVGAATALAMAMPGSKANKEV